MPDRSPRSIQNPDSVRLALREFHEVGREAFLAKYGIGSARKFELVEDGRVYDAKAVLAAAFAYEFPDESPLATTEFDGNDATVRGNLERLGFQVSVLGAADEVSRAALDEFRESAPGRLWLRVRRQRAAALRELLAVPGSVTLDMFNREIWPLESASVLRGQPVKLAAGGGEIRWESADAANLLEALDAGELELHGNYMWGSGTHVYGAMLQADDAEKTRNVQLAAEILNRSDIGPAQKAAELEQIDGFGPNASTGLVMAFYPTEFAIYNQPSRAIVKDLGYPTDTVARFEQSVATLREQLGAEDFLELDLFLYIRSLRATPDGSGKGRSINDIQSRDSVLAAVAEFDRLGQVAFLEKYGFKSADRFFLELDGRRYDSKAIVGAAYGYEFHDRGPLRSNEFSGGAATVQPLLERLGFTVVVEGATSETGYWWVNQGGSYRRAREEGILSAPVSGREGARPPTHWSNMAHLREGDVVLHYSRGNLRAVGRVTERARETDRPLPGYSEETEHVRQAKVEYFDLEPPVALEDIPIDWRLAERKPFMRTGARPGAVNQGYLYPVSAEFVEKLGSRFPSISECLEAAAAFRRQPRRWCIYVPRSGAENFRIGRREEVWGVPKPGRLDGLQEGDEVLLVHDLADDGSPRPSSFPRVALPDFHGRATEVVTIVATSDPYYDDVTVWPDADYPQRFRFHEEGAEEGVLMNAETQPPDVLDAIRRSALEGGRPMPVDGEVIPPPDYPEPSFVEIADAVAAEGLRIDPDVLRRYHLSLKTRGFVILSGLSGSGKTWLTSAYARAVGAAYQLAPVAPNWTTNEDLLGYFNPLENRYVDTPFSRFLREAATEATRAARAGVTAKPYHLVLDEMNLARVEYYFAKFLSAMELRARGESATIELAPTEYVSVPQNLVFVGTVNVDETTHQFADKVYDRAQLIELGISKSPSTSATPRTPRLSWMSGAPSAISPRSPFARSTRSPPTLRKLPYSAHHGWSRSMSSCYRRCCRS
jgi:hypothetical protein